MTCDGKQKEKLNFDYDNFYHLQGQADSYYRNLAVKNKCLMLIRHDKAQNVSTASSFNTFKSSLSCVAKTWCQVNFGSFKCFRNVPFVDAVPQFHLLIYS